MAVAPAGLVGSGRNTVPPLLAAGGSILLDFGREIQGSVELFVPMLPDKKPRSVRVRFGESAAETMVELGDRDAQNDHAIRDMTVTLPSLHPLLKIGVSDEATAQGE